MVDEMQEKVQEEKKERNLVFLWIVVGLIALGGFFALYEFWWKLPSTPPVQKKAAVLPVIKSVPQAKPEERGTLTEGQKRFNGVFTEALLKDALANAGNECDLRMFRNMIRIAMNAESLSGRPGMTWGKWQKERTRIREMARKELSDPIFLKSLWQRYGSIVTGMVRTAGKTGVVKKLCQKAIPYFNEELPHHRFVQLNDYYKTDARLEREIQKRRYNKDAIHKLTERLDKKYRILKAAGLDETDIYLFEFSMRRAHEGGMDLTKAYGDILTDLNKSL